MQKIYEYAILYHPMQTKEQRDRGESRKSIILVPITPILAKDDKEVQVLAARYIPDEYLNRLDQVEVAVRPF